MSDRRLEGFRPAAEQRAMVELLRERLAGTVVARGPARRVPMKRLRTGRQRSGGRAAAA